MAFTPTDPTKAEVRVIGTAPNQSLDFYIPRGAKGEPGGFNTGTDLSSSNLNEILVPGLYRQANSAYSTALNNYPIDGVNGTGVLTVIQQSPGAGGGTLQIFHPVWGNRDGRVQFQRTKINGAAFGPWRCIGYTRTDQTAGRAIYQWDEANAREQLIYGDTGIRRVETSFINGWTGAIASLRRQGYTVQLGLYTITPTERTADIAYNIPLGFRTASYGGNLGFPIRYSGSTNTDYIQIATNGDVLPPTGAVSGNGFINVFTWTTSDAWPTTLPGTASGSLPNV